MTRYTLIAATIVLCACVNVFGDELRIAPPHVSLDNKVATQRLSVFLVKDGKVVKDVTAQAKFSSAKPQSVGVDQSGLVRALENGEAKVIVSYKKQTASIPVRAKLKPFEWSFRNHVIPVITKQGCNSGACHGALAGKGGLKLSLRGFDPEADHFVLTRQAKARRVDLRNPSASLLLQKPTTAIEHGGGLKLPVDSKEFRVLADWIATGAPGPKKNDARIERLEVFPKEAVLKPKDKLQLVVRAWYSDGSSLDVTRWARFSSTGDLVAGVDGKGTVTVSGHGEAAVTVGYSNLVAVARVASPFPNKVDPKVFAKSPRKNFIDDLVLEKLKSLNIPPSPQCDDYTFIRRAYLDTAGILPTPKEVRVFVDDESPKKREQLVVKLLNRSEFVDYWAYQWSDVLLVSGRRLPKPAMWAFYQYVRQSVADNKPWDRFAKEILTASGSNLDNGAANYYVLHKDVVDLTETTSVTFLGMSITCARCHNHPMEKWTQDQYWQFANLFSRVGLKNGKRRDEILVHSQPSGNVLHLRRGVAMQPTPLDAKSLPLSSTKDRRKYFAQWLTKEDNPYFARALVNRVWKNFMGRGLVEAEDDLRETNPPSNPKLLDALAADFVKNNYDVKHLIRKIMNSAAYQRSSRSLPDNKSDDRFYSRYLVRRLSAEVVLDTYSQVTKVPTQFNRVSTAAGDATSKIGDYPLGTRALQLPDTLVVSQFLDSFGRPERSQPCACERTESSSVSQALHLNNGKTLNDKLRSKKSRITGWVQEKLSNEKAIDRIFLLALSREPTKKERRRLLKLMADADRDPTMTRREVFEDLVWAVLTGREFLFIH